MGGDARDVGEGIHPAARGNDDGGHGFVRRDVTGHRDQVQARVPGHQGIQALGADIRRDNPAALPADAQGGRLADPGSCPGNDHRLALEAACRDGFLP